jgi:hypothetical protein
MKLERARKGRSSGVAQTSGLLYRRPAACRRATGTGLGPFSRASHVGTMQTGSVRYAAGCHRLFNVNGPG